MVSISSITAITPNTKIEKFALKTKNVPSASPPELPKDTISFRGNIATTVAKPATTTKIIATILGFLGLGSLAYNAHIKKLETQNESLIKENEKLTKQINSQNYTINELNEEIKKAKIDILKALGVENINENENKKGLAFTYKETPFIMEGNITSDTYTELAKIIQNKEVPEGVTIYNPKATNLPPVDTAKIIYCNSVYNEPIEITSRCTRSDLEDRDWNNMYGGKFSIKYEYEYNGKEYSNSMLSGCNYSRKKLMDLIIKPSIEYRIKQDAIEKSDGIFAELIK